MNSSLIISGALVLTFAEDGCHSFQGRCGSCPEYCYLAPVQIQQPAGTDHSFCWCKTSSFQHLPLGIPSAHLWYRHSWDIVVGSRPSFELVDDIAKGFRSLSGLMQYVAVASMPSPGVFVSLVCRQSSCPLAFECYKILPWIVCPLLILSLH